jgi:hypothetical protein
MLEIKDKEKSAAKGLKVLREYEGKDDERLSA